MARTKKEISDNKKKKDEEVKKENKKEEPKEKTKKEKIQDVILPHGNTANQFWSVVLFAIGVFLLLLTLIQGSSGWYFMHKFIRGMFGGSVFLVAPIFIYASVQLAKDKAQDAVIGRVIQGAILTLVTSGITQIIGVGEVRGDNIKEKLMFLYENGVRLKGGGLLSALVGWPLLEVFGELGALIVILLILFVCIMLLTNLSLFEFFGLFYKPFIKAGKSLKRVAGETSERLKDFVESFCYTEEVDEDTEDDIIEYNEDEETEEDVREEPVIISGIAEVLSNRRKNKSAERQQEADEEIIEMISEPLTDEKDDTYGSDIDIAINDIPPAKPAQSQQKKKADNNNKNSNELERIINSAVSGEIQESSELDQLSLFEDENTDIDETIIQENEEYQLPPLEFLREGKKADTDVSTEELRQNADKLVDTLQSFGVQTRIVGISRGPTVTRYEVQPSVGVKISKVTGLADDIALNLAASGVRMEAPIPGKSAIGIEIPNKNKDMVTLREMLESEEFQNSESKLSFAVGRDIAGKMIIGDIAKMPHVIIAGSTGSGKSVCTNSIIMSILYKATPDEVRLILIDPKIVEFKVYDGIPHLLIPVVTDPRKAAGALNWAVQEMLRRYKLFADNNVRDLASYNEMVEERYETGDTTLDKLPQIVIAIDELADLMMAASNDVETAICRLAQMARAAGMHLIIATQRPTVDVITGLIKANIPSRIAVAVMSQTDSRTILDTGGAEKLLGQGDMLYFPSGIPKPVRVQGCFCPTKDIEKVVEYVKSQFFEDETENGDDIMSEIEKNVPVMKGEKSHSDSSGDGGDDEIIEKAIDVVVEMGQASTSSLQRKLKLGYARAARVMDELENMGIVGAYEGAKPRKVLISKQDWADRKMRKSMEQ